MPGFRRQQVCGVADTTTAPSETATASEPTETSVSSDRDQLHRFRGTGDGSASFLLRRTSCAHRNEYSSCDGDAKA